jgi:hypothetical protein
VSSSSLRVIKRLERSQQGTTLAVVAAGVLITGSQLLMVAGKPAIGWGFIALGLLLEVRSLVRRL